MKAISPCPGQESGFLACHALRGVVTYILHTRIEASRVWWTSSILRANRLWLTNSICMGIKADRVRLISSILPENRVWLTNILCMKIAFEGVDANRVRLTNILRMRTKANRLWSTIPLYIGIEANQVWLTRAYVSAWCVHDYYHTCFWWCRFWVQIILNNKSTRTQLNHTQQT